jgi:PadR family transcriptional regulator, regulatory protein PadR
MVLKRPPEAGDILQGTLDMLILRTLVLGPAHGHTIAQAIERTSENALEVEQGSLYPALHRLEHRGWVSSDWGVSENNRKAKFYRLTEKGRKELNAAAARWRRMTRAIGLILGESFDGREGDRHERAAVCRSDSEGSRLRRGDRRPPRA